MAPHVSAPAAMTGETRSDPFYELEVMCGARVARSTIYARFKVIISSLRTIVYLAIERKVSEIQHSSLPFLSAEISEGSNV